MDIIEIKRYVFELASWLNVLYMLDFSNICGHGSSGVRVVICCY